MEKILVTPRSVTKERHPALGQLERAGYTVVFCRPGVQPSEEELTALLPGCVGYLAGVEPVTARVLDAADRLRVISRNGTGVDNIDLARARERHIAVCRAEGANARGVAELTLAHILAAMRSLCFSDRSLKAGGWERRKGLELENRTLGIIGCGRIGRMVARFALALDMRVLGYDPYPPGDLAPAERFTLTSLERLLSESDVVSLHCPSLSSGPLIDQAALARMKRGAYLVNTARAQLLDDAAVLAALEAGQLAGVTLDVFDPEPPQDQRLAQHPRVTATAHIGGFTEESISRAVTVAVEKLLAVLAQSAGQA